MSNIIETETTDSNKEEEPKNLVSCSGFPIEDFAEKSKEMVFSYSLILHNHGTPHVVNVYYNSFTDDADPLIEMYLIYLYEPETQIIVARYLFSLYPMDDNIHMNQGFIVLSFNPKYQSMMIEKYKTENMETIHSKNIYKILEKYKSPEEIVEEIIKKESENQNLTIVE